MPAGRNPVDPATGWRRPGRPPSVSTTALAEAVLAVGFTDLTVSAVARHVGVNHATVYRYVSGRDALIRLAVDLLAETTEWPEPGPDWRAYLEANAWATWRVLSAHPGLAGILAGAATVSPPMVRHVNRVGEHLVSLGFTPADAVLAFDLVLDLTSDTRLHSGEPDAVAAGTRVRARTAEDRFARKLTVVLTGIAHTLAPGGGSSTSAPSPRCDG